MGLTTFLGVIQPSPSQKSHDLASVAEICDRIAILHKGEIVECGPTEQIVSRPQHEYTKRLMAAMPRIPSASTAAIAAKATGSA